MDNMHAPRVTAEGIRETTELAYGHLVNAAKIDQIDLYTSARAIDIAISLLAGLRAQVLAEAEVSRVRKFPSIF